MDIIQRLTNLFSDFPTVGPRTAQRFVYYLMKQPKERIEEITNTILELKSKIKFCSFCLNPHENENSLCLICANYNRNKNLLCIVEKEQDLISIEKTGKYNGLYFILNLAGSLTRNQEINTLKLEGLKQRIQNPEKFGIKDAKFLEMIIATNPTPEGINSSVLVERILKDIKQDFKITHLARGIPVGGELEYADEETLESAFEGRK
jgi:recombination protein RecR